VAVRYNSEAIVRGCEIINFARGFGKLAEELAKSNPDEQAIAKLTKQLKESSTKYFKDYNAPTDVKMLAAMLQLYYDDVPKEMQPAYLSVVLKKNKHSFEKYAQSVFDKTIFADASKVDLFLSKP